MVKKKVLFQVVLVAYAQFLCGAAAEGDKAVASSSSSSSETRCDEIQSFLFAMFGDSYTNQATKLLDSPASRSILTVAVMYKDPEAFKRDFLLQQESSMGGNNFLRDAESALGQKLLVHVDELAAVQSQFSLLLLSAHEKYKRTMLAAAQAMDKEIYDQLNS